MDLSSRKDIKPQNPLAQRHFPRQHCCILLFWDTRYISMSYLWTTPRGEVLHSFCNPMKAPEVHHLRYDVGPAKVITIDPAQVRGMGLFNDKKDGS